MKATAQTLRYPINELKDKIAGRADLIQLQAHLYDDEDNIIKRVIGTILPYFNTYSIEDLIIGAEEKRVNVIAPQRLNFEIYDELLEKTKKLPDKFSVESDSLAIRIFNKESWEPIYLLNAVEHRTKQDIDIIGIGKCDIKCSGDVKNGPDAYHLVENIIKNDGIATLDHHRVYASSVRRSIPEGRMKIVEGLCKTFGDNLYIEWNAYCKPWLRMLLGGEDVNKKAIKDSELFSAKFGKRYPVYTDMDGHIRYKGGIDEIDRGAVRMDIKDKSSGKAIIEGIKENFDKGNYKNDYRYVSFKHFALNFGIPYVVNKYLFRKLFSDSRAEKNGISL